ncbi:MAG: COR domain-containing protein [Bacteroidia bacterium]
MSQVFTDIQAFRSRYTFDPKKDLLFGDKVLSVYKAIDTETGKTVVVQLFQGPGLNPDSFIAESEPVLQYRHPNLAVHLAFRVVTMKNFFGEETAALVSIHEYIPGKSLLQHLNNPEEIHPHIKTLISGILSGLQYLHNQGFSHGDLHPDNIILQPVGDTFIPRLLNFGYSKLFQAKKTSSGNILLNTGQYMAPEKIVSRDGRNYTGSGDLWALGVIIYELILGKSPFGSQREGHSLAYIFDKIRNSTEIPDSQLIPEPYREIVLSCLNKDPLQRASSADRLLEILLPPAEIAADTATVEAPEEEIHSVRLILLGNDMNNCRRLYAHLTGIMPEDNIYFNDIAIAPHIFTTQGKTVRIQCWIFTDEETLHLTYRYFLSPGCIYALVTKEEKDKNKPDREDWQKIISSLAKDAPIVFVNSENREISPEGLSDFTSQVEEIAANMPHILNPHPANWLHVEAEINALNEDYIDYGEFRKICRKYNIAAENLENLSLFLHEQGMVLHFKDEIALRGISILNPLWISQGIKSIMHSPVVEQQKGLVAVENLEEILDQGIYPPEKQFLLPELMFRFHMSFPIGEGRNYFLIPEKLPLTKPQYFWKQEGSLRFRYEYEYLPESLFSRFIVKVHRYTESDIVWRNGILLYDRDTRAEVICNPEKRVVFIQVNGNAPQYLLELIRNKLAEVHQHYGKLTMRQGIPCICASCQNSPEPFYHNYEEILEYKANHLREKVCTKSFKTVSVSALLSEKAAAFESLVPDPQKNESATENTYLGYVAKNLRKSKARTILFLAANPTETAQLQLARESREIDNGLARASHRLEFKLEQKWAVTPRDFRRALMDIKPEFVHFSGHGTREGVAAGEKDTRSFDWEENPAGGLVFEDEGGTGRGNIVSSEALKSLFGLFPNVQCVLLNACYSKAQAESIAAHIPYVIGMKRPITDKAAIAFAVSFYDAIGASESVEFAFRYACTAIALEGQEGADIPTLLIKGD